MYNNGVYISPLYLKEDYLNLNLNISSNSNDWNSGIKIFENRIKGRFTDLIEELLEKSKWSEEQFQGFSFSIMALNCLLIETLKQFYDGIDETRPRMNKEAFKTFLLSSQFFPEFKSTTAGDFYTDIRCGILH